MKNSIQHRINPTFLKSVKEAIEEYKAIEDFDLKISLESLGFDSLEIADLSIKMEEKVGIYTANPHSWADKSDNTYTLTLKIQKLYHEHQRKFTMGKQ